MREEKVKVLMAASFGGHYKQLMRVCNLLDSEKYEFVITSTNKFLSIDGKNAEYIPDLNANEIWKVIICMPRCFYILMKYRPSYVVSTGALPGLCMLICAKLLRKRTVWIDSIANYSSLSKSGKYARRWADLWGTQWEHLASQDAKLTYMGKVL
ncbi:UDP-N-acetylglucosamine transferase subunit ALG14 [Spongiibacter taiwanensis]|uniref:UDP-N-acetylglucosamine transferase subunit ALG14 n=1 Tax=Spongiibacter taiwanensis TaxID=1748242 RepID=UPI00203586D1|nr:UDP-N-acetylglucosamine transferase subunit ALG14 [Spongiibacter taiwanensis]USA42138.1 UDP-N-acetylglucosamine transferase subunit ALG14 [Spongiibacter taiwanensis]